MKIEDIIPGGVDLPPDERVTAEKLERMNGRTLEGLAAVLWQMQGYRTFVTPTSGDSGVDVVGTNGLEGVLIQCKASGSDAPISPSFERSNVILYPH